MSKEKTKLFLEDFEKLQQQMIGSVREISLDEQEANQLLGLIKETIDWVWRSMKHGYYDDIEFLQSLASWIDYDRHVSQKQMYKFWAMYDKMPENIESGLL